MVSPQPRTGHQTVDTNLILEQRCFDTFLELCRHGSGTWQQEFVALQRLELLLASTGTMPLELNAETVLSVIDSHVVRNLDEGLTAHTLALPEPLVGGDGVLLPDISFRLLTAYLAAFPEIPRPRKFWTRAIPSLLANAPGPAERASMWIRGYIETSPDQPQLTIEVVVALKGILTQWVCTCAPFAAVNLLSLVRHLAPSGWVSTFLLFLCNANHVVSVYVLEGLGSAAMVDRSLREALVIRLVNTFPLTNLAKGWRFLQPIFVLAVADLITPRFVAGIASIVSGPSPLLAERCVDLIVESVAFHEAALRLRDKLLPLAQAALTAIFTTYGAKLARYLLWAQPDLFPLARAAAPVERHRTWLRIGRVCPDFDVVLGRYEPPYGDREFEQLAVQRFVN